MKKKVISFLTSLTMVCSFGSYLPYTVLPAFADPVEDEVQADNTLSAVTSLGWVEGSSATVSWTAVDNANYYAVTVSVYENDGETLIGTADTGTTSAELDVQQEIHNIIGDAEYDTVYVTAAVTAQTKQDDTVTAQSGTVTTDMWEYVLPKLQIPTPTNLRLRDDYVLEFTCDMDDPQEVVDQELGFSMEFGSNSLGSCATGIEWDGKVGRINLRDDFEYLYQQCDIESDNEALDASVMIKLYSSSYKYRGSEFSAYSNKVKYASSTPHIPALKNIKLTNDYKFEFECDIEAPESNVSQDFVFLMNVKNGSTYPGEGTGITWNGNKGTIDLKDDIDRTFISMVSDDKNNVAQYVSFKIQLYPNNQSYGRSSYSNNSNEVKYICSIPHIEQPANLVFNKDYVLEFDCDMEDPNKNVSQEFQYYLSMGDGDGASCLTSGIKWNGTKGSIDFKKIIDDAVNASAYVPYNTPFDVRVVIQLFPANDNYRLSDYSEDSNYVKYTKYKKVESLTLAPEAPIVCTGNSYYLGKTVSPLDAYYENIEWTSDDTGIVTVNDEGMITGVSAGTTYVNAAIDGVTARVPVTVYELSTNLNEQQALDETQQEEITDTASGIIDDIANNDEPDLSDTDISENDLDEIKEELTDAAANGDIWVNFNNQGRGLGHYREYWDDPEFWEWYSSQYGDNNGWHFGWGNDVEYEIGYTDADDEEHHIGNITEFDDEYGFYFEIPEDAQIEELPNGKKRIYSVVRFHNGAYDIVDIEIMKNGKIKVLSDKYSDFMLIYTDVDETDDGHALMHFPAVEPTDTTDGHIEYWYCPDCGKYFSDGEGNNEITQADTVIPKRVPGDANRNGKTDVEDVLLIQQYIAGWEVDIDEEAADVDGSGKPTVGDVLLIQQFIAGWGVELR